MKSQRKRRKKDNKKEAICESLCKLYHTCGSNLSDSIHSEEKSKCPIKNYGFIEIFPLKQK